MEKTSFSKKSSDTLAQGTSPVNKGNTASEGEPHHGKTKKHLVKAAGIMSLMTLLSRVLGLVRDVVSANRYGTSWQWDSFIYAFMLPNFFRRLVGEGGLSSAFIPVYSEIQHQKGDQEAFYFTNIVGSIIAGSLAVIVGVIGILLTIALQFDFLPPRIVLTVDLLRYFFPYLWFMSIFALGMSILNCNKKFFAPSIGPVVLDIFWIVGVVWVAPKMGSVPENQLRALAWVVLLSGLAQVLMLIPPVLKTGMRFQWAWKPKYEGFQKTINLILPAILGFTIVQVNMLVDMTIGMMAGPGANSALWYGARIMQFPLGMFTIAMGTALLPTLSQQIAAKHYESASKTLSFVLRSVCLIILPCMFGLIILREPVVKMLFERGEFDAVSTARTASVLMYYCVGLWFFSGEKIMAAAFYASQDTRTPVKLGIISMIINIVLNLILMQFMKESGLALATSIASMVEFVLMVYLYHKKVFKFPFGEVLHSFVRILGASIAMGVVAAGSYHLLRNHVFTASDFHHLALAVFSSITAGAAAYLIFCFIFRVPEIREARDWLMKRKRNSPVKP